MPSWSDLFRELRSVGSIHDVIRRRSLQEMSEYTGRNVICYYSAFLEKAQQALQGVTGFEVKDQDKNGFMATSHGLDRSKGLDLILHTPGGDAAATESIVDYLRDMFGNDIRAIVPHLALSAGTMIALSCNQILMGRHSALGPVDPQIYGIPAHAVVEEFNRARKEITENPSTIPLWQPIIAKYTPTLVGECEKAIEWSNELTRTWLSSGMFAEDSKSESDAKIDKVMQELADHAFNKSHSRHISLAHAKDIGLNAVAIEEDQELQDKVLTVYHACVLTASETGLIKIIENQEGVTFANVMQVVAQVAPQQQQPLPGQGGTTTPPPPPGQPSQGLPRSPARKRR